MHGFEQIIDGASVESLDGMLIECGYNDDHRGWKAAHVLNHFETAHHRHLKIKEHQIGPEFGDLEQRLFSVGCFANDLDGWKEFEFLPKDPACNWLVVHNQSLHVTLAHPFNGLSRIGKFCQAKLVDGL